MPKPTDEDIQLFREAVKEIKPLEKNDKVVFRKKPSKARLKKPLLNSTEEFGFSDHIRETVSAEQTLFFHRSGLQYKVLRALRQGNITPTAKLDLHDNTIDQARDKLDKFLQYCLQTQQRCVHIIHGKGKNMPLLKNHVNNWLQQYPAVLAFCSTLPRHGGTGALYVLLRRQR